MKTSDVLVDAFGRIRHLVDRSVAGLDAAALAFRPDADANPIGWLVWHLTRIQDDHVAEIAGLGQIWTTAGWGDRFGMPADPHDTGFGHTSEQVAAFTPPNPEALVDYHSSVSNHTLEYLATIDADELDRVIDTSYDPPVRVGVRLISVISDNLQHAGQAMYVRGIIERTR